MRAPFQRAQVGKGSAFAGTAYKRILEKARTPDSHPYPVMIILIPITERLKQRGFIPPSIDYKYQP